MKNFLITLTLFATIAGTAALASAPRAHAATSDRTSYTLLEPIPSLSNNGVIKTVDVSSYLKYLFNLAIALAAALAVFMMVWGGFQYMSTDAWSGKKDGIKKVQNALWGLLLILTSYLILKTVDPRLVDIPANFVPPIKCMSADGTTQIACDFTSGNQLNDILSNTDRYTGQIAEAKGQATAAQTNVNSLNSRIQEANDRGDTSAAKTLTAQRDQAQLDYDLKTQESAMLAQARGLTIQQQPSYAKANQTEAEFISSYTNAQQNLIARGATEAQKQELANMGNYALGEIQLQKVYLDNQRSDIKINAIDSSIINQTAANIKDPALRNQLIKDANSVKDKISKQ